MGDGGVAGLLDRIEGGDQAIPIGGFFEAKLIEDRLVRPDPIGGVDVDRGGDPRAVIFGEALEGSRHHIVPAFLGSRSVQVRDHALLGPVQNVEAEHLDRSRWVACGYAGAEHGHRLLAATAGDRHVLPADILGLQVILQHVEGGSLTTRRPPVKNLNLALCERRTGGQGQGRSQQHRTKSHQKPPLFVHT